MSLSVSGSSPVHTHAERAVLEHAEYEGVAHTGLHSELREILEQFKRPGLSSDEKIELYQAISQYVKSSFSLKLEHPTESLEEGAEHAVLALEVAKYIEEGLLAANELDLTSLGEIVEGLELIASSTEGAVSVLSGLSFGFAAYMTKVIANKIAEVKAAIQACDQQLQHLNVGFGDNEAAVELLELRKQALELQLDELMLKQAQVVDRLVVNGLSLLDTLGSVTDVVLDHADWFGAVFEHAVEGLDFVDSISGGVSVVAGGVLAPFHFIRALSAGTRKGELEDQVVELEMELNKTQSPVIASILKVKIDVLRRSASNLVTTKVKRFVKSAAGTLKTIGGAVALSSLVLGPAALAAGSVIGGAGLAIKGTEMTVSATQSVYERSGELYHGARSVVPVVQKKLLNRQLAQAEAEVEVTQRLHDEALEVLQREQEIVRATEEAFEATRSQLLGRPDVAQQQLLQLEAQRAEMVNPSLAKIGAAVEQIFVTEEKLQEQAHRVDEISHKLEALQGVIQEIGKEQQFHAHHRQLETVDKTTLKVMHRVVNHAVSSPEYREDVLAFLAGKGVEPVSDELTSDDVYRYIFSA